MTCPIQKLPRLKAMQRFGAGDLPFLPIRLPQTLQPEGFAEGEEEGGQGEAG